ncbi:pyridoxal-dependent decarboxylase, exosortase system type 1 associated [Thiorhodococcus drewsii AZ1]|uniref:Pyridoxal-dependent decarboxylase, exosortase system type 1 associated n=1 Tax=Thiorhodococcus drewsii AZ1 TaxID=765913 RepID=G2E5Z7_9GAMM|nr:pyridoxal-dependent decarboxylase, exosortase A system-associated [Thiorhodococcus drewsii]EGV28482.1 pyridoxal-dependent decarboxylase, exosortase system type 1 associated [Thiorhodococcus drewsii AZ1]
MHPFPLAFAVQANQLVVGGERVGALVERVGSTPLYVYDRAVMSERIATLRQALPAGLHLHYAVKANPMPAVLRHLAGCVDGFDVASGGELTLALEAGMAAQRISFAGPGKRREELEQAVAAGVQISVESESQLAAVAQVGARFGLRPRVAIRVNPDFELKSSGMRMGGGASPFGIDAERLPILLSRLDGEVLDFRGLHVFAGSQNLSAVAIAEAQQHTLALAGRLAEHVPGPLHSLNLGGGFGIPYFPGDRPLDLAEVGARLAQSMMPMPPALRETQLIIELGRYIVGEAGLYLCRVLERKVSRGQCFLITDGGLHHHLAASGNLGQVIRKNYPVVVANRVISSEPETPATVVGPLCTPLDRLAVDMPLGHARVGDLIGILQSGAYGLTASPTGFLSHPLPQEVLV